MSEVSTYPPNYNLIYLSYHATYYIGGFNLPSELYPYLFILPCNLLYRRFQILPNYILVKYRMVFFIGEIGGF
jgi:hypothetical protein